MRRSSAQLRRDALEIWQAGLAAVDSRRLILDAVEVAGGELRLGESYVELREIDRIAIVGGGKAAAGMAAACEEALGPRLLAEKRVAGCVNVPSDCVVITDAVELVAARPAGCNEPTEQGVIGVRRMLQLVAELGPRDVCLCLISGGASALMPAPIAGFSLAEKAALTRELSACGATIDEMNTVRSALSEVKGGGLARACRAGRLLSLVLSDVPGDDLATIGSGPTVATRRRPNEAIAVLRALSLDRRPVGAKAVAMLAALPEAGNAHEPPASFTTDRGCIVTNTIIGNNALAVDAAGIAAERLGYSHAMTAASGPEGSAEDVARRIVEMAGRMQSDRNGPDCLIWGGEPTVVLAPSETRGQGGRNQQLCLAALAELADWSGLALLSGGTDGEDGPTDAAGACVDEQVALEARRLELDAREHLARNDAYTFFTAAGGLLATGPTHTNVCDLRVLTVSR